MQLFRDDSAGLSQQPGEAGAAEPGAGGWEPPDNDGQIEVALRREPSQDELEHTNRVVQSALAEFRHRPAQQR